MHTEQAIRRWFFALLAVVYVSSFPYLQAINNPNENTRTYLVMALVDHGTFHLDPVVKRFGWTNDMAKVPDPRAPGGAHLASVKGPFMSVIGVPVYAAQKTVLRLFGKRPPGPTAPPAEAAAWLRTTTLTLQLFCAHLPCFAFLVWLERRLRRLTDDVVLRLAAVAAVGLGTNYLAYAFVFVSHAWSAIAAFAALDLVHAERARLRGSPGAMPDAKIALATGVFLGLGTLLEYQGVFLSAALGLYALTVFWRPRVLGALALGAGACAAVLMLFQWRSFGSPLASGHKMMETQAFGELWKAGFLGFTAPNREAIVGLLFDRGYGFFGTSPFFWLIALFPLALLRRVPSASAIEARRAAWVSLVASGILVLTLGSSLMWRGGWTIGPRYLGALPGLLVVPLVMGLDAAAEASSRAVVRGIAGGLALASFLQTGVLSLLVSTLPEAITRPVPQIVLPFLSLGLVPHHAGELFGIGDPRVFMLGPAAAFTALFLVLAAPIGESGAMRGTRAVLGFAVAALALSPALRLPVGEPDHGAEVRALFYDKWEPAGRDALSMARTAAERDACAFHEVARLETMLGRAREAERARAAAAGCATR